VRQSLRSAGGPFAAIVACALALAPAPRVQDDLAAALQAKVTALLTEAHVPGITATVTMPGDRVFDAAAGWADDAQTVPVTKTSRMPAGSVGKTFVAAAILRAVDAGRLDLDAKISAAVGGEPWFARVPNHADLTLRLLLQHRSGLPDAQESRAFVDAIANNLDRTWTPSDLIAFVLDKKPRFRAGAKYFYTDMNYIVAGAVFEKVMGTPLFRAIENELLAPNQLSDTVAQDRRDWRGVVPGLLEPDAVKWFHHRWSMADARPVFAAQAEYGGGGLISTAHDLARWARVLYEGRVFTAARLEEMLNALPSGDGDKYGLGVTVLQSGAGPVYGHDGTMFGYQTVMLYFPKDQVSVAVQINADLMKSQKVGPGSLAGQIVGIAIRSLHGK